MRKTLNIAWCFLAGLFFLVLGYLFWLQPLELCREIRSPVLAALGRASTVRVVEHSDRSDIIPFDPNYKEITYAVVTLNQNQIESLRKALPLASASGGVLMCGFEEHHSIEIDQKDGSKLTLHLCFHCGQLSMNDEGDRIMPQGWKDSISEFIASIGLHPGGPWDKYPEGPK